MLSPIARIGQAAELEAWAEAHGPVTIGLAGAGQMGTDIVVECALMKGVRVGAICARRPDNALAAVAMAGYPRDHAAFADTAAAIDRTIEAGRIAITSDFNAMCASGRIDVVVDATGNPNVGTELALASMAGGKHIVMLNVEADITIGRYLKQEARKAGVVYTGAAGDEPAATLELIAFAQSIGLDIIAAGKGKNNALNPLAVPADYEEEAAARNMNARVLVEFVDGSKTNVEMTAIANATGLVPDVPGMHGPAATREVLAQVLCAREDGGVLSGAGRVDYTIGKGVAPGVFCIAKPRHPRVLERMVDLKVGPGPCFALFRPFHLTSLETPLSAARAVMYRRPDMQPLDRPVAECTALAKRDLKPGEKLGRIGETDYRGHTMRWEEARAAAALPMGLAEGSVVTRPVARGGQLTWDNCAPDESFAVTRLRRRLDQADAVFLPAPAV